MTDDIRRGDVVLVDLDPTQGSELNKTRPAVVIQNDMGNQYSSTTIVAPTTGTKKEYPFVVRVSSDESPFDKDTTVRLDQIRVISKSDRIVTTLGSLDEATMDAIDKALKVSLALD